jgi:hypothetical protein
MASIVEVAVNIRQKLRSVNGPSAPVWLFNAVEFLAQLFEDNTITDTDSGNEVQKRLMNMLNASAGGASSGDPGGLTGSGYLLHFGGIFNNCSDGGFRAAFRDPWPGASNNQVGHFMSAVDMGYRPVFAKTVVPNMHLPIAPNVPMEESFCISLIVGHEQVPDDAYGAVYRQALSPSTSNIQKFYQAVGNVPLTTTLPDLNLSRSRANLTGIPIGNGRGNSLQDLFLSLYGYGFGRLIRMGRMDKRPDAAHWLRVYLGNP